MCRLITLAYPGPATVLLDIVGRDAFLEALNNQTLRVRIIEHEPKNLDEALNVASRLEAFDKFGNRNQKEDEYHRGTGKAIRVAVSEQ